MIDMILKNWPEWDENALRARNFRGLIHLSNNDLYRAFIEFRRVNARDPSFVPAVNNLAAVWMKWNQHAAALAAFDSSLQLDPSHFTLQNRSDRAKAKFLLGRYQDAADAYAEMIQLAPDDAIAYFNLGFTLAQMARVDTSATMKERACKMFREGYDRAARAKLPASQLRDIEAQLQPQDTCGTAASFDRS